jgi:hypothetical protein
MSDVFLHSLATQQHPVLIPTVPFMGAIYIYSRMDSIKLKVWHFYM